MVQDKSEGRMTNSFKTSDAISLTVCQVDRAYLPAWLGSFPDTRNDNTIVVVTWLRPHIVSQIGLPRGSICGFLTDPTEAVNPELFVESRGFVDVILELCREHMDPQLVE